MRLIITAVALLLPLTAVAAPNVCKTVQETEDQVKFKLDPTRRPISSDVHPDGSVTFHFQDNHPPPITVNGSEAPPDPVHGVNRELQLYLHKKAASVLRRCFWEEGHKRHHPDRGGVR